MGMHFIRVIDRWLGTVLCALLTLWRRADDLLRAPTAAPVKRVMFLKLIEQGATVVAYEALRRAVARYGRENVFFCVFRANRPILDLIAIIPKKNIFEIRDENLWVFASDVLAMLRSCRRQHIDAVIDMEFFARAPAILAFLTGARRRVGMHRFTMEGPYRGDLMTHRIAFNPYLHVAKTYCLLIDALERDPREHPMPKVDPSTLSCAVPRFESTESEVDVVQTKLHQAGFDDTLAGPVVLVNANCSDLLPIRRWPTESFAELIQDILEDYADAQIVLTGAPSEAPGAERLANAIGSNRVISMAGRTSLRELFVLYQLGDVLITNDSGPAHFASMTDIHKIIIYGPETPQLFGVLGGRATMMWKGLACSPCGNVFNHRFSPCSDPVCMKAITPSEVYKKFAQVVGTSERPIRGAVVERRRPYAVPVPELLLADPRGAEPDELDER